MAPDMNQHTMDSKQHAAVYRATDWAIEGHVANGFYVFIMFSIIEAIRAHTHIILGETALEKA